MTEINHFYHIYADGYWKQCMHEHLLAMKTYGLFDTIAGFHIGIVGQEGNRNQVKEYLAENDVPFSVVDEQLEGWEQVTMNKLYDFAQDNDGLIFYAHTKGAYNNTPINNAWRSSMCYYNVVKWKDAIEHFNGEIDTVGCHWCHNAFWGGTYWWVTTDYIKTLNYPLADSRWRAEEWIGSGTPRIFDMNPGWPDFERFIMSW